MEINGYTLVNPDKVVRAAEGNPTSEGTPSGGVGYYNEALLLAQYDKLGGLIKNSEGYKVKTGSFFDFKANAPRETPEVILLVQVGFETAEVPEGEPMPREVEAARVLEDAKKKGPKKGPKKVVRVKGKGKGAVTIPEDAEAGE